MSMLPAVFLGFSGAHYLNAILTDTSTAGKKEFFLYPNAADRNISNPSSRDTVFTGFTLISPV